MRDGEEGRTEIAAAVQAFYERHPYPGPAGRLGDADQAGNGDEARRAEHHLFSPGTGFRADRSILIASCGTVQAARHAMCWPQARVTGIDVSAASIEAQELGRCFDRVICTGVLHHLPDPDAGLAALRNVLAPQGAMHLMLYAPYGRAGIYMVQDYCRRLGIATTSAEIAEVAAALKALPPGHPLWPLLRSSPDFQHEAGLADALLHPRDRPYSVPDVLEFAARAGLRFGR